MDTNKIASIIVAIFAITAAIYNIIDKQLSIAEKRQSQPQANKNFLQNSILPFFSTKYFLVPFITICSFASGYFIKQAFLPDNQKNGLKKIRIVVMMPTDAKAKPVYQDGLRQLDGFAEYINNNVEKSAYYEFIPLSHNNDPKLAKDIIIREIKQGTNYFISTMSKVDVELAKDWLSILKDCGIDTNAKNYPKLICTVASSPKIKPVKDCVYRFYIRSNDECKSLVDFAKLQGFTRAICIVVADQYGNGALDEYKSNFQAGDFKNIQLVKTIFLNNDLSYSEIRNEIKNETEKVNPTTRDAIFIAHYGSGIVNIFKALYELRINSVVFSSSTLSIPDWQEPIKNELHNMNWYTCFPAYNTPESAIYDASKNDVIKNFTTYTIAGLIFTLDKMRNDPKSSFHENWQGAFGDMDFRVGKEEEDYIIPLIVKGKDFFKK
jgi:hypothetical protein